MALHPTLIAAVAVLFLQPHGAFPVATSPPSAEATASWTAASARLDRFRVAMERERHGDLDGALELLSAGADGDDPMARAMNFHLTRIQLHRGTVGPDEIKGLVPKVGSPTLRWGITRRHEAELLLAAAAANARDGDKIAARKLRLRAALDYPQWVAEPPRLSSDLLLLRARNLVRDMDYAAAVQIFTRLRAQARGDPWAELTRELGRVIGDKMRDDYRHAAALFREVHQSPHGRPEDLLYQAYATGKFDDIAAAALYRQYADRYSTRGDRSKALFLLAWTEFDLERFKSAVAAFEDFMSRYPTSGYRGVLRWYRALANFRLSRFDAAAEDFDYLRRRSSQYIRAGYWLARTHLEQGNQRRAHELLGKVVADDPISYYGLLARALLPAAQRRPLLRAMDAPAAVDSAATVGPAALRRLPPRLRGYVDEAVAVAKAGEPDLAAALLEHVEGQGLSTARFAAIWDYLQPRLGLAHRHIRGPAARGCRGLLAQEPVGSTVRRCWETLYPKPYADAIAAVRGPVPAEFYWSIMRQESFFIPTARSHADALGLMQVIPQVGRLAAHAAGETFAPYEMLRPKVNLPYFAHAASMRYHEFGGHLPLLAMSYNATPERTWAWLADNWDLPFDLFVEEIPYGETRDYVKRIAMNLFRYRTLAKVSTGDGDFLARAGLPHPTAMVAEVYGDLLGPMAAYVPPRPSHAAYAEAETGPARDRPQATLGDN